MSNHSDDVDNEMMKKFDAQLADAINKRLVREPDHRVGPTGQFPRGKLTKDDRGQIGIRVTAVDGTVVIDFGKPTSWIGFPPEDARALAESLVKFANEIEGA